MSLISSGASSAQQAGTLLPQPGDRYKWTSFGLLMLLPANLSFPVFAVLLLMNGLGVGMFSAPNTTGIMNSVPNDERGVASGMRATFQNTGMVLSILLFFSLMIVGLSSTLPASMSAGLQANGVPAATATRIAFTASLIMCLVAAAASWMRGKKYVHGDYDTGGSTESGPFGAPQDTGAGAADEAPIAGSWVPA